MVGQVWRTVMLPTAEAFLPGTERLALGIPFAFFD